MSDESITDAVEIADVYIHRSIPYGVLNDEFKTSSARKTFIAELNKIFTYYDTYRKGKDFAVDCGTDYVPSTLKFKKARNLINKEARFMFSTPIDFYVNKDQNETDVQKDNNTILFNFLRNVLDKNFFDKNILKASKDCFIAGRVGCILNFNGDSGISVDFLNALEFYYEMQGPDMLTKFVAFFTDVDADSNIEKRIRKKSYWMGQDGYCWVKEELYNGAGILLDVLFKEQATKFKYIPAVVIFNDGLTSDVKGESEIEDYESMEQYFNKLMNSDFDAERKSMNPIRYTINASPESTSNLSSGPGAFWDIQSDENGVETKNASVGQIESSMSYSSALSATLDRVDSEMHSAASVPNVDSDKLQGLITSGKTLKALYWSMIVRCDEKMQTWGAAVKFIANCIFDGALLYEDAAKFYTNEDIPLVEVTIDIDNNYALPEDEQDEKNVDLAEVSAQVMSRSSYMKKWRKLTDKEIESELRQIAYESELLSGNSFGFDESDKSDDDVEDDSLLEDPSMSVDAQSGQ